MQHPDCRPEDDEYLLYLELTPCPRCDGSGETVGDDDLGCTCRHCDGSGHDPDAPPFGEED